MSITEELRNWVRGCGTCVTADLTAIADRIDETHEKAMGEIGAAPLTDEQLAEHGLARLPVDADGEPWHVGDAMADLRGGYCKVEGWQYDDTGYRLATHAWSMWFEPGEQHHHKPTPAERIREVCDDSDHYDMSDKCRKALRAIADELEGNGE